MIKLEMSDKDIVFVDENSNNISVSKEYIPFEDVDVGEIVEIHFEEDEDDVSHQFKIAQILEDKFMLDWIKQLNEELLTEAPLQKALQKGIRNTERANIRDAKKISRENLKLRNNTIKLLRRDLSAEGRGWKFYFMKPDGKFEDSVDQNVAKSKYTSAGDDLTAEIVNAIVVDRNGFIVRRGMEDLAGKGIKLTQSTSKIDEKYLLPWEDETPFDPSNDTEAQDKGEGTESEDTSKSSDASTETDSEDKTSDKTSTEKQENRYDLGISSNTYKHFLKLLYVMRPKLYDAFDKPVNVSSIKELNDKVKYNNLADFEIEIDGQKIPAIKWIQTAVKNKVLMEKVLSEAPSFSFDDSDLMDPDKISLKGKMDQAVQKEKEAAILDARKKKEEELKVKSEGLLDKIIQSKKNSDSTDETLEIIFDVLVPSEGPADSQAGELVRAIMRILYRDANDGDKFFEGYGIETCGSSAEYLFDNGFAEDIQNIMDKSWQLSDDDDKYTDSITLIAQHVIDKIISNPELMWTINDSDSRNYSTDYVTENQPTYEFELYGSDDIITLVEKGVLTSWDLTKYVEGELEWESDYRGAEVATPWSHHDTSVTVTNLTKNGYDRLRDAFQHDPEKWWEDLTSEYSEDLSDDEYDDDYDIGDSSSEEE